MLWSSCFIHGYRGKKSSCNSYVEDTFWSYRVPSKGCMRDVWHTIRLRGRLIFKMAAQAALLPPHQAASRFSLPKTLTRGPLSALARPRAVSRWSKPFCCRAAGCQLLGLHTRHVQAAAGSFQRARSRGWQLREAAAGSWPDGAPHSPRPAPRSRGSDPPGHGRASSWQRWRATF